MTLDQLKIKFEREFRERFPLLGKLDKFSEIGSYTSCEEDVLSLVFSALETAYEAGKEEKSTFNGKTAGEIAAKNYSEGCEYGKLSTLLQLEEKVLGKKKSCNNRVCQDEKCVLRSYNSALSDILHEIEKLKQ